MTNGHLLKGITVCGNICLPSHMRSSLKGNYLLDRPFDFFLKGSYILGLPVHFSELQTPSEKGSAKVGINFFLLGWPT